MADPSTDSKLSPSAQRMIRDVGVRQDRMVRARGRRGGNWTSIAILGVIGWSVALPTVGGIALGIWMDNRWPSSFSWTLTLLFAGLIFGCVTAWLKIKGDQA